ncbi:MAG: hypothetical protein IT478_11760 [Xanthomonadales bacterium]|nr:hypothetical protein [Xanthomonadales bacterium]
MIRHLAATLVVFMLSSLAMLHAAPVGSVAAKAHATMAAPATDPLDGIEPLYLEHSGTQHFIELREADNRMRIRRGKVGLPCLVYELSWVTPNAGRVQFDKLRQRFTEQGYVAGKPSRPIVEGSKAGQLFTDEILTHPRYAKFFDLGWAEDLRSERKRLFHFANGLHYDDHLDLEEIADMGLEAGLIIEGDVRVKGVFSQLTYTYPGSTLILGDVYASSFGHADSFLRIDGDLSVDNIVYGYYNDGSLQVTGTASGRLWYSYDHDMSANAYRIRQLEWGETEGLCADLRAASDAEDDSFDSLLRERMYSGKSPLCESR